MATEIELIGGGPGGKELRDFLAVSHNNDGTLKNAGATILSAILAAGNDAGGLKITDLGAPSGASDAVNKAYVDGLVIAAQTLGAVLAAGNDAGLLGIANLADPVSAQDAATKHYVDAQDAATSNLNTVLTAGNDAGAHKIANLGTPTFSTDAATKAYVDALTRTLSQVLAAGADAGAFRITNLGAPSVPTDAATKGYVDSLGAHALSAVLAIGADAGGVEITNLGTPVNANDAATKGYVDLPVNTTQAGTAYTLALADAATIVTFTSATGCTVTIPPSSSVNFPVNTVLYVRSGSSAGTVTITNGLGVTIKNPYNSFALAGQCAEVKLFKIGADTWSINGEVA